MTVTRESAGAFATHLRRLGAEQGSAREPDRAALAALRRGLGQPPGAALEMYPYVVPYSGNEPTDEHFIVAALYASHPKSVMTGYSNFGRSLSILRQGEAEKEGGDEETGGAVGARLRALLRTRAEDMPDHLRRLVQLLRTQEIPVDWGQLLYDLVSMRHDARGVRRRWATAFWSRASDEPPDPSPDSATAEPQGKEGNA